MVSVSAGHCGFEVHRLDQLLEGWLPFLEELQLYR
jgi:hypothetical protein